MNLASDPGKNCQINNVHECLFLHRFLLKLLPDEGLFLFCTGLECPIFAPKRGGSSPGEGAQGDVADVTSHGDALLLEQNVALKVVDCHSE